MEIHVRQDEREQVATAVEIQVAVRARRQGHRAIFRALERRRGNAGEIVDHALHACVEFGERGFGVLELRRIGAGQARGGELGDVGGDLHLAQQRNHVRRKPHAEQYRGFPGVRFGMGIALLQDMPQLGERACEGGNDVVVDGEAHALVLRCGARSVRSVRHHRQPVLVG